LSTFSEKQTIYQHDLSSVKKVSELSFPDEEVIGVVDGHAVLEAEHRLLAQRAVGHLQLAGAVTLACHVVQGDVDLVVGLKRK